MTEPRAPDPGGDQEFERRSRAVFAASVQRLDAERSGRLAAARRRALEASHERPFRVPGLWLPAGALASAAALALAVYIANPSLRPAALAEVAPVEDMELLATNDGIDLYAEDPEFYEWASSVDASNGTPNSPGVG